MKVFVAASSSFWDKLPAIKEKLERLGHEVMLPSTVEDPGLEERTWKECTPQCVQELWDGSSLH